MWWQTLNISPEADIKEIKRAYASLIKNYRPDSHPEEFNKIRQAFEQARKNAKSKSNPKINQTTDTQFDHVVITQSHEPSLDQGDPFIVSEKDGEDNTQHSQNDDHLIHFNFDEASYEENQEDKEVYATNNIWQEQSARENEKLASYNAYIENMLAWKAKGYYLDDSFNQLFKHHAFNYFENNELIKQKLFEFLCENIELKKGIFFYSPSIRRLALVGLNDFFHWGEDTLFLNKYDEGKVKLIFDIIEEPKKETKYNKVKRFILSPFKLALWLFKKVFKLFTFLFAFFIAGKIILVFIYILIYLYDAIFG